MTDEQAGEYLRHLEEIAKARHRQPTDGAAWPLIRHATPTERLLARLWLWLVRAR